MKHMSDNKKEIILIIFAFLVYAISYVGRYSYNSNVNAITEYYHISSAEFGLAGTLFFAAYGIGQFVNAALCKKYNKRLLIPISLAISAVLNLVLFFQPDFRVYKYMWLINGASLSILWPTLYETISKNIGKKNIKKAIVIVSASLATGTLIVYGLSALFNAFQIYQYIFLVATILSFAMAIIWFITLPSLLKRDEPVVIEETENENIPTNNSEKKNKWIFMAILIAMGIMMAISNLLREGLNTWVPKLLKDSFALSDSFSLALTLILPFFGIFSALISVAVNSKIKNYMTCSFLFFSLSTIAVGLILLSLSQNILALSLIMFGLITLLMHCVNSLLTSVAPLKLRAVISAGLLSGVLNGCGYIGSTVSSYGLGAVADAAGWNGVIYTLLGCCAFATLLALIFIFLTNKSKTRE